MPSHVFRSFWLEGEVSPAEHLCIKSFLEHGHRYVLYSYGDVENVPPGCERADAAGVLRRDQVFYYKSGLGIGSVSAFTNLFRYKLLNDEGGWWVDTDVVCLAGDIPETEFVFGIHSEVDSEYGTAIMKAPRASPLVALAFARASELGADVYYTQPGPGMLSELIRELNLEGEGWEPRELYPLPWDDALAVLDPGRTAALEQAASGAKFFHLWTSVFRFFNVETTTQPPDGSYLAALYERHGMSPISSDRYEWSRLMPVVELQKSHWWLWREVQSLRKQLRECQESAARRASPDAGGAEPEPTSPAQQSQ